MRHQAQIDELLDAGEFTVLAADSHGEPTAVVLAKAANPGTTREQITQFLAALYALLDDRDRAYYEHRLAA